MNLEKIAQQAMDYLDSVDVAADYEIDEDAEYVLCVHTDIASHRFKYHASKHALKIIKNAYPQKAPIKRGYMFYFLAVLGFSTFLTVGSL